MKRMAYIFVDVLVIFGGSYIVWSLMARIPRFADISYDSALLYWFIGHVIGHLRN